MANRVLTEDAWEALLEALAVFWWRKNGLQRWLRRHLSEYPELLAPLDFNDTKRHTAGQIVDAMSAREER